MVVLLSNNKHSVSKAKKAVSFFYSYVISIYYIFSSSQRTNKHDQS